MNEFDENKQSQNEESNTAENQEVNNKDNENNTGYQQVPPQNTNPYTQGNGYQQNPYQNQQFNRTPNYPNNNTGYYGQNNANNGYYGQNPYGRSPNYVYYGNNQQQQRPYGAQTPYNPSNSAYTMNGEYKPANSEKSKRKGVKVFVAIIVAIVVFSVICTVLASFGVINSDDSKEKVDGPQISVSESNSATTTDESGELTAVGVYEKVKEASVGILVYSNYGTNALSGQGSGVIVGEDDAGKYTYIITCAHVVSDGGTIKVQLYDESQYSATLIGYDVKTDIAVLRIAKSGLTATEIGDSQSLAVGETVYAIGNPGGVSFAGSFTNGMISSIARPVNSQIGYEMNCIQHTAAINPGNSGGALVNSKGQLIGINSSKIASTDYEGMGFAVPSSTFVEVYNEIVKHGYVTNRPKLGITYTPAQSSQTYSMLVGVKGLPAGSLVIKSITSDSSLVNTQVQVGDLITKVNGEELDTIDKLPDLIENSKVGDQLTLTICHIDANYQLTEFDVTVSLVEDKGNSTVVAEEQTTQAYNPFEYFYGQNGR